MDLDCLFRTEPFAPRLPAIAPMRRHLDAPVGRNRGNFAAFDPHHALTPVAPARLQLSQEQP